MQLSEENARLSAEISQQQAQLESINARVAEAEAELSRDRYREEGQRLEAQVLPSSRDAVLCHAMLCRAQLCSPATPLWLFGATWLSIGQCRTCTCSLCSRVLDGLFASGHGWACFVVGNGAGGLPSCVL